MVTDISASPPDDLTTPLRLGSHLVPGVWRYLLPDDLSFMRFPSECQSTCADCPKVKEEGFHPDYRCCTYHPQIPNFLLGFALEDPETAPMIEQMIASGMATPEGLQATASQLRHSLEQATDKETAKNNAVVCRFLDVKNRRCGIYKYRNSVCSTFFCKHDQGDEGYDFWSKLQAIAGQHETALGQWSMEQMGIEVAAYFARFDTLSATIPSDGDQAGESWSAAAQGILWESWLGREKEFYLGCAALVRQKKHELLEILAHRVPLTPKVYDQAFMASLPPLLQRELIANGATGGEPAAASDLWYVFQLAHRNLWQKNSH